MYDKKKSVNVRGKEGHKKSVTGITDLDVYYWHSKQECPRWKQSIQEVRVGASAASRWDGESDGVYE